MCAVRYRGPPSTGVILRSPASENQTILPTTDNVPLTIKGFAGGLSDVLDIYDTSTPQVLDWKILGSIPGLLSPKGIGAAIGTLQSFLPTGTDTYELFVSGDTSPRLILGQGVFGTQPVPSGEITFGAGGASLQSVHILASSTGGNFLLIEGFGTLTPGGIEIVGGELFAANRRIQESSGFVQITDTAGIVLFQVGPSGEVQILPVAGVIPLTVKGFAGAASDVLDVYNAANPQTLAWSFDKSGNLILQGPLAAKSQKLMLKAPTPATYSVFWLDSAGILNIGDSATDSAGNQVKTSTGITQWVFNQPIGVLKLFTGVGTAGPTNEYLIFNTATGELDLGISGPLVLFGNKIDNTNNLMQFLSLILEQLVADPAVNTTARVYERTDLVRLSWMTGTQTRRLLDSRNSLRSGSFNNAIAGGANSVTLSFFGLGLSNEPDTNYLVVVEQQWNAGGYWITGKAVGGFTINWPTVAPVGGSTYSFGVERQDNQAV